MPAAGDSVSHSQFSNVVQGQSPEAVTFTVVWPPCAATDQLAAPMEKLPTPPLCEMVKLFPAIVRAPLRGAQFVFALTEKFTMPFPVPLPPKLIVIQPAELLAFQLHPEPAATLTLPLPPPAVKFALLEESAYVQGVPACVTVKIFPASVTVPDRVSWPGFTDAVTITLLDPTPPKIDTVNHSCELDAVHSQPAEAFTLTLV